MGLLDMNILLGCHIIRIVLAKKLRLDYKSVARAGLLHDFFITEDLKESYRKISAFVHPYIALTNACKYFELNEMEKVLLLLICFQLCLISS